jgi:hypothetical protein
MNRRNILSLSVITALGLVLLPASTIAQQKTLKEQLVGSWMLVSCSGPSPGGANFCTNPNGIMILDASGQSAAFFSPRGRPKLTGDRTTANAEQFKAATQNVVANFGTWSVNEADKTLTRHFEGALIPNAEGNDAKVSVSVAGDELKVVGLLPNSPSSEAVFRRAK